MTLIALHFHILMCVCDESQWDGRHPSDSCCHNLIYRGGYLHGAMYLTTIFFLPFIFQLVSLLHHLTVVNNVYLPPPAASWGNPFYSSILPAVRSLITSVFTRALFSFPSGHIRCCILVTAGDNALNCKCFVHKLEHLFTLHLSCDGQIII